MTVAPSATAAGLFRPLAHRVTFHTGLLRAAPSHCLQLEAFIVCAEVDRLLVCSFKAATLRADKSGAARQLVQRQFHKPDSEQLQEFQSETAVLDAEECWKLGEELSKRKGDAFHPTAFSK